MMPLGFKCDRQKEAMKQINQGRGLARGVMGMGSDGNADRMDVIDRVKDVMV